ncbi:MULTISPECIES: S24 family peptidase [unclassified Flavobacterium]|jgi:phage repressor protein C with HTH and peptisase S24 domain|uniref:S24 family peptidase n=1 Tax=unclassified Flavobacterium TaxID=196869 RepID=UPI000ADB6B8C|nr:MULTISPECIES: S24 family peptidase [unclassified Flavobacterium]MDQ1164590.1 phage repressor protein C with HTH and peptisase S24 domain [Flavobacterium sp. SORGH_AS_0622]BDU25115.1 transcriptional regulator [Flavobacterium sp. GSB-24]
MGSTERMREYLDYKGISKYKFCNDLGFSNKFLDNSSNMGTDKACKILHYYPEINSEWLLTGNGPMIKEENTSVMIMNNDRKTVDPTHVSQEIPLYDLEAVAGLRELFSSGEPQRILDTIKIPNLPKCDGAISVTGDSMYPLLKSGDIILYKETEFENIFFGEMYLLSVKLNDWEEYITVKYVQKSEQGSDFVKLVSQNSHHQPKDIHISKISALALIKASIRINTMM